MNYHKIYTSLIETAKSRQVCGYVERHHIIPKCFGGNNTKSNLVYLSAREHFIAHWLLTKIYPNHSGMNMALHAMRASNKSHDRYSTKITSRVFSKIKDKLYGENGLMENGVWLGKKHTELTKNKLSKSRYEYLQNNPKEMERMKNLSSNRTPEQNAKISASNKGQKRSNEAKRNISNGLRGKNVGYKNGMSKRVVVKGKNYGSVTEAHHENPELKLHTIYYRINSKNFSDYYYPNER